MRKFLILFMCLVSFGVFAEENDKGGISPYTLWSKHCAKCHGQVDYKTTEPVATKIGAKMGAAENIFTSCYGKDSTSIAEVISEGRDRMPKFNKKLTKEEIEVLASFLEYASVIDRVVKNREEIQKKLDYINENYKNLPECEFVK